MRRLESFFLLVILLLALPAFAGYTLEQIMGGPFTNQLTASRQGERIAWVFNLRGSSNVWTAEGPDFQAHQVTHYSGDDGMPLASLRLTADGKTAVYVRGSELNGEKEVANPNSRTEAAKQQVFSISVDGGEPKLLGEMGCDEEGCEDVELSPDGQWALWATRKQLWFAPVSGQQPAKQLGQIRGEQSNPLWSPDGKQIAFESGRGDHSLIAVVDFPEPKNVRYLAPSSDRDVLPRWSPDGKQIAFIRLPGAQYKQPMIPIRPTPWAIYIADVATGNAKQIWASSNTRDGSFYGLSIDDAFRWTQGRITFSSEEDGRNHLYSIPATGGKAALLTPGDFDVENVRLSSDGSTFYYSSNQGDIDRRHIWIVNVSGGGSPQKPLTSGDTLEWRPIDTGDGKFRLCISSTYNTPGMPYVISGERRSIAKEALPADFPADQLVIPREVTFKSEDGLLIHGQLFVPRDVKGAGPAIIHTHGGPPRQMMPGFHYSYYYNNAYEENQYLAGQGYVVLTVNYRLGIMYGRAFREPADAGWRGSSEYKDVLAGARFLQSLPIVDKTKIGLWGGSYGGLLTALGLARNSDVFAAGVDFHGVHDWSVIVGRRAGSVNAPPDAEQAFKLAYESSPVASVDNWKSPVLLIHGDDDRNVGFQQTTDLLQKLRARKVDVEELIFPDEIHDFLLWRHWVEAYRATAGFFDRKLK